MISLITIIQGNILYNSTSDFRPQICGEMECLNIGFECYKTLRNCIQVVPGGMWNTSGECSLC